MSERPPVTVTVRFFAQARERAGVSSAPLSLPAGSRLADALDALARRHEALEPLWPHLAVAVDGRLAARDEVLESGSEVALLPPVSGG
jgi:molybdopterin synthase catalytic subunit